LLAVLYILLSFATGFCLIETLLPKLSLISEKTFTGRQISLSKLFVLIPAWYCSGTLAMTWPVYILACLFNKNDNNLMIANTIVMSAAAVYIVISLFLLLKKKQRRFSADIKKLTLSELIILALICVLICVLMFRTLSNKDGQLYVGLSVFSDFSTHLSMIRSFSHGSNYPTWYSFFAGQDVKYHFMFQFLCGNLEFLGLRLDLAFNIPSILSLISAYMMLYAFAVKLTGSKLIGKLTWAFFTFRSSWALFEYIKNIDNGHILKTLAENTEFIGATNHEDWGLWNLNVYCNQRHLAFSLTVMILVIMLMLPPLYKMAERLKGEASVKSFFMNSLLAREGWAVKDLRTCIFAGLILGGIGFFNGAVLIGTVMILFFIAAGSDQRLEFVITAAIAGGLSMLQSKTFIDGSLFEPQFFYGFLSEPRTLFSSIDFIWKMMGIVSLVLIAEFVIVKGVKRYLMICFSIPILFSFYVSLTPDIAVNHKYIMMAIMFLDIFAAELVVRLWRIKSLMVKAVTVIIIACLTLSGVYETEIVIKKNNDESAFKFDNEDPLTEWIWENTDAHDIFLTGNYYLTPGGYGSKILLSGAMIYYGWEYFTWSAGYDTDARGYLVHNIYSCSDPDLLYDMVDETGVKYIVVDERNRGAEEYELCEWIFDLCYKKVYSDGEGYDQISIYDASEKLLMR